MTAVELDRITLSLGGRSILNDVTFAVGEGEFVAVLGPNGAGKTTLMRAILGLLPISAGVIRVMENVAVRGNTAIGYLPQLHRPVDGLRLSGREFVASTAQGHRWGIPHLDAQTRSDVTWALNGLAPPNSPPGRWRASPAANASASCWRRPCWGGQSCCCSTNR